MKNLPRTVEKVNDTRVGVHVSGINLKPARCCECGSGEHTIPMPINDRVRYIDICIADIVAALNAASITTIGCCCGHGASLGSILLEDGRCLTTGPTERDEDGIVVLPGYCQHD